jgi:hypothetical protein
MSGILLDVVAHAALPVFAGSEHRKQECLLERSLWCRNSPFPSATNIRTCVPVSISRQPGVEKLRKTARGIGRHGDRNDTMILLAYRHELRVSELINLRWDQFDLDQGLLHVRRLKHGVPSTHPLTDAEIRALCRTSGYRHSGLLLEI